jgi:hypothetical protein
VKLYPELMNNGLLLPEQLMSGLQGSVCSVNMPTKNSQHAAGSLHNTLPHHLDILASMMSITFAGFGRLPPFNPCNFLGVSCSCTIRALQWLKSNNREYALITIVASVLNGIHDDDILTSIAICDDTAPSTINTAFAKGVGYILDKPNNVNIISGDLVDSCPDQLLPGKLFDIIYPCWQKSEGGG